MKKSQCNRNRKLQTSKAPLKIQAQGTTLFTSAASNRKGFPKNRPWEAQVRLPEGERRLISRAHSFPRPAEFRAEPRNLGFTVEFEPRNSKRNSSFCRRMPRNLTFFIRTTI